MSLSYNYPPQIAYPSAPPVYRAFPRPPRLHWAWVLVLSIVTFGMFWAIWMVVQARWVKKATGWANPLWWTLAYLTFVVGIVLAAIGGNVFITVTGRHDLYLTFITTLRTLRRIVGFLLYVAAVFALKSGLESEPIRIPLLGLVTFFGGPVYFQYYLRNYSVEGRLGEQLSGFEEPGVDAPMPEVPPQA